ncbi:hypothetical protein A3Q56_05721 [Intoshia linei]|uniref:RING finger protein unkempt n=1 Tax=Intoshia linei TaxID=1819745 RepID=A0A177AX34_9BILA|nr:hypothetical protein A3Q56_05721 [Intoshia linei]
MINTQEKYLTQFRVNQCVAFLHHKCTEHRPFVCFNWHFQNQKRRKSVLTKENMFNYDANVYCTKYDENTGACPNNSECPYLHRTAGDAERRYHLHNKNICSKNGIHCPYAHTNLELRSIVQDDHEINETSMYNSQQNIFKFENILDTYVSKAQQQMESDRKIMNNDYDWLDPKHIILNYKTTLCELIPRLCKQGYACPSYHNERDRRRNPVEFKYRSTTCPNAKPGEEWNSVLTCELKDNCSLCHTRTEQQFHPEIYKSTKCCDVLQSGYCPRGNFCAFAHNDEELHELRSLYTSVIDTSSTKLNKEKIIFDDSTDNLPIENSDILIANLKIENSFLRLERDLCKAKTMEMAKQFNLNGFSLSNDILLYLEDKNLFKKQLPDDNFGGSNAKPKFETIKCFCCNENNRDIVLECNHYIICEKCASKYHKIPCPICEKNL